jgi:hypothetical protein
VPKKMTGMRAVNQQFLARIKPEFESWGLSQHPNPTACFGGSSHGYRYDFADLSDSADVRIACFSIIQPAASLFIGGAHFGQLREDERDISMLWGNTPGLFHLTRRWSILRPMSVAFELPWRSKKPLMDQASDLIDDVVHRLPKLKNHLYDG